MKITKDNRNLRNFDDQITALTEEKQEYIRFWLSTHLDYLDKIIKEDISCFIYFYLLNNPRIFINLSFFNIDGIAFAYSDIESLFGDLQLESPYELLSILKDIYCKYCSNNSLFYTEQNILSNLSINIDQIKINFFNMKHENIGHIMFLNTKDFNKKSIDIIMNQIIKNKDKMFELLKSTKDKLLKNQLVLPQGSNLTSNSLLQYGNINYINTAVETIHPVISPYYGRSRNN